MKSKRKSKKVARRRPKGTGGVIQKGEKWYGRIRRDGSTQLTDGYADAEAAERALDKMISSGVNPRFIPTLSEYWHDLLTDGGDFEDRYDEATRDLYDTCRARYFATEDGDVRRLGFALGAKRLDQIRKPDVQRVINRLYSALKPATVRRYGSCLHTVLKHAVDAELLSPRIEAGRFIPANPADGIVFRQIQATDSYVLTDTELVSVPEMLFSYSKRLSAMVTVLCDTGARPGELCAMNADDITAEGVWIIRDTRRRDGSLKGTTKTKRVRRILLTDDARAAIARHGASKGPVWLTKDGKPMNPGWLGCQLRRFRASLQRKWDEAAEAAGTEALKVPPLTARNCRKTFATRAVETGDLKSAQAALGHSTAEMTLNIYAQSRQDPQDALIRKLAERTGNRALFAHRDQDRVPNTECASSA